MGFCMVCHLVAHARLEDKCSAIFQFRVQLALEAKQDVPLAAPMVSQIACRVFDHAHPDMAKMLCAPVSNALMVSADVCTPPVAASEQLSSGERIASHRSRSGSSAESDNRRCGCASISSMLMSGW